MPFLPLSGGQLQDDPNNTTTTDLNITSPSSSAHIDVYTEDDVNPGDGTAYVEVQDSNGTAVYGSTGISDGTYTMTFPSLSNNEVIAVQSDIPTASDLAGAGLTVDQNGALEVDPSSITGFLPLTGGTLQDSSVGTELVVKSPDNDTWLSVGANDSGIPRIIFTDTLTNPSNGDIKELKISTDRIDITAYNQSSGNWRGDSLFYPELKSGTIALDSDLAGKQDTLVSGTNIKTINGNSILGNGDLTISGGQSYTAGNGIDITSGTISVDATDLDGSGLTTNANGELEVDTTTIQPKLTAGSGISISAQNVISATGGGSGLWTSGTGTNSLLSPAAQAANADATGTGSVAGGNKSVLYANYATAFGESYIGNINLSSIDSSHSFAAGRSTVLGKDSFAFGTYDITGDNNIALGGSNVVQEVDNAVLLNGQHCSSDYGLAACGGNAGGNTPHTSNPTYQVAIGDGTQTYNRSEVALGRKNKSSSGQTDNLKTYFSIGDSTSTASNAFEIMVNNDLYVRNVGGYDGTNAGGGGIKTLQTVLNGKQDTLTAGTGISISAQNVISATGGGGTSFTAGDGLELDANDNLNVLYGSGLTLSANNELEVDPSSITGFLPLAGGMLQEDPNNSGTTELMIQTPESNGSIIIDASDTDPNLGESQVHIDMSDSFGSVYIYTNGVSDGTYTTSWPSPSADTTFATLEDVSGFLPLVGGTLQEDPNNAASTDLVIQSPESYATAAIETVDLDPGNTAESMAKITLSDYDSSNNLHEAVYTSTGISDGTYTLSFPTLSQNETIATLSDIQGGGSYVAGSGIDITSGTISVDETYLDSVYLPIIGGSLENTSNHTDLRVDAPNSESDNFVDILSPGTGVPSVELGTDTNTQGDVESLKFKGDADIDIKYVGDNTTYTLSFPTLTQNETIATLSDIQGGGTSYTAGTGISISAQNVISNSAPDPGFWVAGDNLGGIRDSRASISKGADATAIGPGSIVNGYQSTAIAGGQVGNISNAKSTCTAVGSGAYCNANYTTAFGIGTRAFNQYESSVGTYSNSITGGTNAENTEFTIGVGTDGSARMNLLEAKKNHDVYLIGVGNFDGTNAGSAGVETLQQAIANAGGGGGNYLSLDGGVLKDTTAGATNTELLVQSPDTYASVGFGAENDDSPTTPASAYLELNDYSGDLIFTTTGIEDANGYVLSFPTLTQDETIATLSDIQGGGGGGLWLSGTGTDSLVAPGTDAAGLAVDPAPGTGAISCGYDTDANGDYSFACGGASEANGDYSFVANNGVVGQGADYSAAFNTSGANGYCSFAAGDGSVAGAAGSVALAGGNVVYDDSDPQNVIDAANGIAIGSMGFVEGVDCVAIQGNALASASASIALLGTVYGDNCLAGPMAHAYGQNSFASGGESYSYPYSSIALGDFVITYDQANPSDPDDPNAGEVALGRLNYTEADLVFTIGCGIPDQGMGEVRRNAIAINSNGDIFIKGLGGYTGTSTSGCTSLQTLLANI